MSLANFVERIQKVTAESRAESKLEIELTIILKDLLNASRLIAILTLMKPSRVSAWRK